MIDTKKVQYIHTCTCTLDSLYVSLILLQHVDPSIEILQAPALLCIIQVCHKLQYILSSAHYYVSFHVYPLIGINYRCITPAQHQFEGPP